MVARLRLGSREVIVAEAFSHYAKLARVRDYCQRNHSEHIPLSVAAEIAGLERTYFSSYFRHKVGVCFTVWLTVLRIDAAKQRIQTSDTSIARVAHDVGFRNLTTFERAFKNCVGITAAQYRQRTRQSWHGRAANIPADSP